MKTILSITVLFMILIAGTLSAFSQATKAITKKENSMNATMKTYVIEREILMPPN